MNSDFLFKIRLRPVICGFSCQVLLGLLCIRWEVGRSIFKCFGDKVAKLLSFSIVGSTFVYGEYLSETAGVFAFAVGKRFSFFVKPNDIDSNFSFLFLSGVVRHILCQLFDFNFVLSRRHAMDCDKVGLVVANINWHNGV